MRVPEPPAWTSPFGSANVSLCCLRYLVTAAKPLTFATTYQFGVTAFAQPPRAATVAEAKRRRLAGGRPELVVNPKPLNGAERRTFRLAGHRVSDGGLGTTFERLVTSRARRQGLAPAPGTPTRPQRGTGRSTPRRTQPSKDADSTAHFRQRVIKCVETARSAGKDIPAPAEYSAAFDDGIECLRKAGSERPCASTVFYSLSKGVEPADATCPLEKGWPAAARGELAGSWRHARGRGRLRRARRCLAHAPRCPPLPLWPTAPPVVALALVAVAALVAALLVAMVALVAALVALVVATMARAPARAPARALSRALAGSPGTPPCPPSLLAWTRRGL